MKSLKHYHYLLMAIGLITISLSLGISLLHLAQISQKNDHMLERDWQKAEEAHRFDAQIRKSGSMLMEMLIANEALQTEAILPRMHSMESAMRQSMAALGSSTADQTEQGFLRAITDASSRYTGSYEHARQLISQGKKDEATKLINYETLPLLDAVQEPVLSLIDLQQKHLSDGRQAINAQILQARSQLFMLITVAVIATLLTMILLPRRQEAGSTNLPRPKMPGNTATPSAPVQSVERNWRTAPPAQSLDNCTLECKRPAPSATRTTRTTRDDGIDIIARERSESSYTPKPASVDGQPARAASRAQTMAQNSSHPYLADPSSPSATPASQKGDRLVTQVVDTMGLIKAHSNQIVALINVMDDIACDTARLAQHAEAARAVASGAAASGAAASGNDLMQVADEVRALAQRASAVATEIRLLTDESAARLHYGPDRVDQAGETINDIVASVKRVSGMIRQMSNNPPQGSSDTINQTRATTGANGRHQTTLFGHMAATAHGMQQKAEQVAHAVSLYKLGTLGQPGKPGSALIIDLAAMRKRAAAKNRSNLSIKG